MLNIINKVVTACAVWFVVISINTGIYLLSETLAAILYLASLGGFVGWIIFKVILAVSKRELPK